MMIGSDGMGLCKMAEVMAGVCVRVYVFFNCYIRSRRTLGLRSLAQSGTSASSGS